MHRPMRMNLVLYIVLPLLGSVIECLESLPKAVVKQLMTHNEIRRTAELHTPLKR